MKEYKGKRQKNKKKKEPNQKANSERGESEDLNFSLQAWPNPTCRENIFLEIDAVYSVYRKTHIPILISHIRSCFWWHLSKNKQTNPNK